jgi:hypothetical protein
LHPVAPRSPTIRLLAALLIALLLAICIGIAAWAGLLALQRPAVTAAPLPPIAPIVAPSLPARLPAAVEFERGTLPATARREHPATTVQVRVPAVPTLQGAAPGIAVYDAATGADFVWMPIDLASAATDGSVTVTAATHVRGELMVAFAASAEWARHGYLARATVTVDAASDRDVTIELPVVTEEVELTLPPDAATTGPLRLSRCDDPQWLPTFHSATGITVAPDHPVRLLLGAGCYELIDPIDADRRQAFDVPTAVPVVLTAPLVPVRADRP